MRFYKMLLALILSTNLANAYDTTIIYCKGYFKKNM